MSHHFKTRSLTTVLIVAVLLITFVACNPEITPSSEDTQISFVPYASKALNQTGEIQDTSSYEDVNLFHWKYKIATSKQQLTDAQWNDFSDQTQQDTGLGTIYGLIRGETYWFALEGWTTDKEPERIWYGETSQGFVLSSKVSLVTISVTPVGTGSLFFSIEAPVVFENPLYNDIFVVESISKLDGTVISSNTNLVASLNSDKDTFSYSSVKYQPDFELPSGTYMVVVKQQTTFDGQKYIDADGRKTIVIITIQSGINTIIKGSLDSSTMQVITYNAGAEGFDEGMEVDFLSATDLGQTLALIAKNSSGTDYPVLNNSTLEVKDNEYVKLVYTTKTDVTDTLKIYVNKTLLDMTSKTDLGFIKDLNGKPSLIKCDAENEILAYGKEDNTYIVTVRYDNLSKSFSITGIPSDLT